MLSKKALFPLQNMSELQKKQKLGKENFPYSCRLYLLTISVIFLGKSKKKQKR